MLSSETVEAIFRRLYVRYGSAWSAKWAGIPEADVKADWSRVLGHLSKESVLYGLEYLPEFVPTAHQFREICVRAPERRLPELPAPKPTDEEKARVRAMLKSLRDKITLRHA